MHRDVKPENMLLCNRRRLLKLADFGCAKQWDVQEHTLVGTRGYIAPEVSHSTYNFECDIYS